MPVTPVTWTPEAVLITIGFGFITILLALVSWLGKRQLDSIITNQAEHLNRQTNCRETLGDRFADRVSTQTEIRDLTHRINKHSAILTRHRVLLGDHD